MTKAIDRLRAAASEHRNKAPSAEQLMAELNHSAENDARHDLEFWTFAIQAQMKRSRLPYFSISTSKWRSNYELSSSIISNSRLIRYWAHLPAMETYAKELERLLGEPFKIYATRNEVNDRTDRDYPSYFEMMITWK